MKRLALAFLISIPSVAAAQATDCDADDYLEEAMAHLESHYRSFPDELFTTQLYLKDGFGREELTADGKWGPRTATAVCDSLQQYTDAGGSDGDWGIRRASHTPQFTTWLLTTARAALTGADEEAAD